MTCMAHGKHLVHCPSLLCILGSTLTDCVALRINNGSIREHVNRILTVFVSALNQPACSTSWRLRTQLLLRRLLQRPPLIFGLFNWSANATHLAPSLGLSRIRILQQSYQTSSAVATLSNAANKTFWASSVDCFVSRLFNWPSIVT